MLTINAVLNSIKPKTLGKCCIDICGLAFLFTGLVQKNALPPYSDRIRVFLILAQFIRYHYTIQTYISQE